MNEEEYFENLAKLYHDAQASVVANLIVLKDKKNGISEYPSWLEMDEAYRKSSILIMRKFISASLVINQKIVKEVELKKADFHLEFSKTQDRCHFCKKMTTMIIRKTGFGRVVRVCDLHMNQGPTFLEEIFNKNNPE